jgi:hypothetical protein
MGFFLFLFLFILVLGLAVVGSILNFFVRLFSFGKRGQASANHREDSASSAQHGGKKVFGKEEGEYVDFEEVKE